MIAEATRREIIDNKFAYTHGEVLTVYASELCEEVIAHDHAKHKIKLLEARIELLASLLAVPVTPVAYRHVNLRA